MNCFNNNIPNITASERTRNVKVRSIYKSTRRDYQIRGECADFNGKIGFYTQTGQLRNTNSYDTFSNLNRGYALCVDGAADPEEHSLYNISGQSIYRGLASCARHDKINPMRVKLVNGRNSIYNIFNGGNWDPRALFAGAHHLIGFLYGFPVIKTFPDLSGVCHSLEPFAQHDGSWNILNYPLGNADGCGVVIDPSNILFGTDFCPTDIDNRTQGANKYLTFAQTASFILATGQLFDASGKVINCDSSRNYIHPGMIIMGGVGGTTGDIEAPALPGAPAPAPPTIRQVFAANFMTSWGIIERACCGTGPNNEPNWWEIYIKPSNGALIPQEKLPVTVHIPNVGDPNEVWATIAETSGSIGGKQVEWGGIWEYGPTPLYAPPKPHGSWNGIANMSTARLDMGLAALDGKLYAVGGQDDNDNILASGEAYDPATNTWTAIDPISKARWGCRLAALGTKVYAAGGLDNNLNTLASGEAYDPGTNTWTAIADMSTARLDLGLAALGTKVYAVGGHGHNLGDFFASGEAYDPGTNTWTAIASMSTARTMFGLAALGTKVYAVGGVCDGAGNVLANGEAYDPGTNTWTAIAPMSTVRYGLGLAALDGKLYAVGGENGNVLASGEAYDPGTNTWTAITSVAVARLWLGLAALETKLYAVGGDADNDTTLASGEVYTPSSSPHLPDGNLFTNFGKEPGGGGIAIFDSIAVLRAIALGKDTTTEKTGYPPVATMGWRRRPGTHPAPWKLTNVKVEKAFVEDEGYWIKEPYVIISGVGSCAKNLLFGNNTKQNYLVSYDPRSKNVRFNINDKILRKYSM